MPILQMRHQREPLSLHAVTAKPQARNIVAAGRTMCDDRVTLDVLRRLERLHAAVPLAQERGRRIGFGNRDGRSDRSGDLSSTVT
jgi:hypothetical protein